MSAIASNPIFSRIHANRGIIFPLAFMSLLLVILMPLPTQVLDFLLIINMTISAIVMVSTIYVSSPLEFSVFPSLLLSMTMFRLVLNAATTRLILTAGQNGEDVQMAMHSAGEVVRTFSAFV